MWIIQNGFICTLGVAIYLKYCCCCVQLKTKHHTLLQQHQTHTWNMIIAVAYISFLTSIQWKMYIWAIETTPIFFGKYYSLDWLIDMSFTPNTIEKKLIQDLHTLHCCRKIVCAQQKLNDVKSSAVHSRIVSRNLIARGGCLS